MIKNNKKKPTSLEIIDPLDEDTVSELRAFEDKLKDIELSPEVKNSIVIEQGEEVLSKSVTGAIPWLGGAVDSLISFSDLVDKKFRLKKTEMLIGQCVIILNQLEGGVEKLKSFLSDPYGYSLYNKIRRITEDKPPLPEYIRLLGTGLANITNSDFINKFSDHSSILEIINRLSPHALLILNNLREWPSFNSTQVTSSGEPPKPMWVEHLTSSYCKKIGLTEDPQELRLYSAFMELYKEELIQKVFTHPPVEGENQFKGQLSALGKEVYNFISDSPVTEKDKDLHRKKTPDDSGGGSLTF